jgi:cytosine permease
VVNRRVVTILVGTVGSVLAALGILTHFIDFLIILGVVIPPIAGIMVTEYYLVRTWRAELERSRDGLPATEPTLIIGTLVVWLIAALVGRFVAWGIPSLNSLVVAVLLYLAFSKVGLLKPLSIQPSRFGAAS